MDWRGNSLDPALLLFKKRYRGFAWNMVLHLRNKKEPILIGLYNVKYPRNYEGLINIESIAGKYLFGIDPVTDIARKDIFPCVIRNRLDWVIILISWKKLGYLQKLPQLLFCLKTEITENVLEYLIIWEFSSTELIMSFTSWNMFSPKRVSTKFDSYHFDLPSCILLSSTSSVEIPRIPISERYSCETTVHRLDSFCNFHNYSA